MPKAIAPRRKTWKARQQLRKAAAAAKSKGDHGKWRRCKAVLSYLEGEGVIEIAKHLDAARSSIYGWLDWYNACGLGGLEAGKSTGRPPQLSDEQKEALATAIDAGPIAAGYQSGVWTGPMIGDWIRRQFGVSYHNHHVPRLLSGLGFSVQRPRKRLARADKEAQEYWIRTKLPRIKKSPPVRRHRAV
jgi:transposase